MCLRRSLAHISYMYMFFSSVTFAGGGGGSWLRYWFLIGERVVCSLVYQLSSRHVFIFIDRNISVT